MIAHGWGVGLLKLEEYFDSKPTNFISYNPQVADDCLTDIVQSRENISMKDRLLRAIDTHDVQELQTFPANMFEDG